MVKQASRPQVILKTQLPICLDYRPHNRPQLCPWSKLQVELFLLNIYRISLNKVLGHQLNQQFQKCKNLNNVPFLCTKLFQKRGNYSRGDIIRGRTIFKEIRYMILPALFHRFLSCCNAGAIFRILIFGPIVGMSTMS